MSIDLERDFATNKMDITDLKFKDNTFDVIICIHVLQFIEEDIKAMREMYRVLKPGGWAIIQTFLDSSREKTFEDPKVKTPEERKTAYGFDTMTRIYGKDYGDRLRQAGFQVTANQYLRSFSLTDVKKYGLTLNYGQLNDEDIYICVK